MGDHEILAEPEMVNMLRGVLPGRLTFQLDLNSEVNRKMQSIGVGATVWVREEQHPDRKPFARMKLVSTQPGVIGSQGKARWTVEVLPQARPRE